jgi:EAL domain-containing protein (putative c-di-GMP-specific phosphodiesterase class I)
MTTFKQERDEQLLLVDDDFTVRTAMAAALERPGRRIITCADLESAQLLVETLPIDTTIADVRLSGPFGCEGLDLIRYAVERQPAMRIVLMTGDASQEMRREATLRGAIALLQKPFCIDDIEAAIGSRPDDRAIDRSQVIDVPSLDAILAEGRLSSAFQPIVTDNGEVFGYESLARLPGEAPYNDPEFLFRYAERKRRLFDLELACIESTFRNSCHLPQNVRLFINVHPHALALGSRFTEPMFTSAARWRVPLDRVVVEITEQAALLNDSDTNAALGALRDKGVSFAFDDVGIAFSHYTDLLRVRPAFLKVSNQFGTGFEADTYRSKIVRNINSLAEDFGIAVILEGVESEATARAASKIGIRYMQGYWFGRPVDSRLLTAAGSSVN